MLRVMQPATDPGSNAPPARVQEPTARPPGWLAQVGLVFQKDLLIETRTGEVVTTSAFFALLVVVTASLSFYGGPTTKHLVAAGVLWLSVSFATVLALTRTWQRERDEGALDGLLSAPLSRSALFAGKALGLWVFIMVVQCVVVPATALLFSLDVGKLGLGLLVITLFATHGLAATGTLFGSMTVRTGARDLILAVVIFPLLSPTLLAAVVATRELLNGAPLGQLWDYLKLMAVFDLTFISGGLALFGTLAEG
jgi:heme exporter protein B